MLIMSIISADNDAPIYCLLRDEADAKLFEQSTQANGLGTGPVVNGNVIESASLPP
jgi:hypothetical protein